MNNQSKSEVLAHSVPTVARALSVSERKIWKDIYNRKIAYIKIGTRTLIPDAELKRYISERTVPAYEPRGENCSI